MVSFAKRKELASDLKALFAAPEREMALGLAASVAGKWRVKGREKVAEHVEEQWRSA
ncbi:MAG: transposase [Actinomycetota bacterium]|nr:transposase [Actinomycetota bacterium]